MAIEINSLLMSILLYESQSKKLNTEYKRVKKINDLLLSKQTENNIYLDVLKKTLKRYDYLLSKKFEKITGEKK